jgi:hypothetical protein
MASCLGQKRKIRCNRSGRGLTIAVVHMPDEEKTQRSEMG